MATVTSPILTDATFATKMDALAAAVKPDASDIPLTPPSGMTATNVQDGFSEIKQSLSQLDNMIVYKDLTPIDSYADFDDGAPLPIISLQVANIEYTQAGSGEPSPSNPRPINGVGDINIIVSPNSDFSGGITYPVSFIYNGNPYYIYKGDIDVISGKATIRGVCVKYDGSENWSLYGSGSASAYAMVIQGEYHDLDIDSIPKADYLQGIPRTATWGNYDYFVSTDTIKQLICGIRTITTPNEWKTYLSNHNLHIYYDLVTPIVIQLDPTQILSLLGQNYISTDEGEISNIKYLGIWNRI